MFMQLSAIITFQLSEPLRAKLTNMAQFSIYKFKIKTLFYKVGTWIKWYNVHKNI